MNGGPRLFVYYRLPESDVAVAVAAIQDAQRGLCSDCPGLVAELMQRPDLSADAQRTLMETYVAPDGIGAELRSRIESTLAAALAPWLAAGARHVEVFERLPCAS